MLIPSLLSAALNLNLDSVTFSGDRTTDTDYGASPSANQYVGVYTDSGNSVKVRFTLVDIIGGGGDKPEGSYEHAVAGDNATIGATFDFVGNVDGSGNADDGFWETGPGDNNPGIFTRYRVEFLNMNETARALDDYRLSIFDIDYTDGERIERVQIEDQYITSEIRWSDDGSIVNANYTGPTVFTDPELNASAPKDVSFVERRTNETLNVVAFRTFAGLANFDRFEDSNNASPMGGVSVVLSDVQEFEIIVGSESTNTNARTRARFILDFGDPPDNPSVVVPEPKAFAGLLGILSLGFVLSRRQRRIVRR